MTKIWDEFEHIPKPMINDWVEKWKPIINEALEKAAKWDLLDKIGGPPKGDARIHWHIDMCNLRIKLEAVKTWAQRNAKADPKWLAEEEFIKLVKILDEKK